MLTEALTWLSRGVVPVPLKPRSKCPAIPWGRLRQHRPPPAVVRRWFDNPEGNLGLLCGKVSGDLVVLDFDRPLAYHRWAKGHPDLSHSYTVKTQRGYHVYLRIPELPPLTLSLPGADVKASGYVVAPPSVHPSGHLYESLNREMAIAQVDSAAGAGIQVSGTIHEPFSPEQSYPSSLPSRGLVSEIKVSLSIVVFLSRHTQLYPSSPDGVYLMANCPFHDDRNPSMWVNAQWGVCRCFRSDCRGAKRAMDVINVYALLRNLTNEQAIRVLATELGL